MKTLSRVRNFFQGFHDVGPETKGFGVELVLAFFMLCSLAVFFYFSAAEKRELAANAGMTENAVTTATIQN